MKVFLKKSEQSKLLAFVQLVLIYGLVFNPWTTFPYTFIFIIICVLLVTYWNDKAFHNIGLKTNRGILKTIGMSLLIFVSIAPIMDFIIQPLVNKLTGEITDYSAFQSIAHNASKYTKYLFYVIISASIGEEILFRGFVFRQLEIGLPDFKYKTVVIVLMSALLFSLPHIYQGLSGLIMTFIFGLIFAIIYIKTNFNLWVTMIVHGLIDIMFLTLAYFDGLGYYVLGNDLFFGY
ncbi:hypothetical protein LX77_03231 [Gelidibacter algens]|uniref:CAAX prenyl protease 2/Lysostaphin resistance protein A-like domain-containing protein n=1 Tax=Gelidibacter algens TaxID=49280 RepID=A0A1A7R0X7_9FLAO|nr:type II CAAX endopeptidase family protein [Gelidibacter algens]OBX25129.1 hypothetical protein A9996_11530 [Gelidibacter algens]RAJ20017.1 hypothetical protein LX77_03231 [Gelidibacter algens]